MPGKWCKTTLNQNGTQRSVLVIPGDTCVNALRCILGWLLMCRFFCIVENFFIDMFDQFFLVRLVLFKARRHIYSIIIWSNLCWWKGSWSPSKVWRILLGVKNQNQTNYSVLKDWGVFVSERLFNFHYWPLWWWAVTERRRLGSISLRIEWHRTGHNKVWCTLKFNGNTYCTRLNFLHVKFSWPRAIECWYFYLVSSIKTQIAF